MRLKGLMEKIIVKLGFEKLIGNTLTVSDNGKGFDINTRPDSMGMTIIETLAEQIEGSLVILSNEQGTEVKLTF